jgi:hypothetical protein
MDTSPGYRRRWVGLEKPILEAYTLLEAPVARARRLQLATRDTGVT